MNKILIYYSNGICKYSAEKSKTFLKKFFNSDIILSDNLNNLKQYSMICIPGGIGSKVINELKNSQIKNFVKNGGNYLGICCGAYLACNRIIFENNIKMGLNLVNLDSIGPIYQDPNQKKFDINNPNNIQIQLIHDTFLKKNYFGYLHGGGYFDVLPDELLTSNLERYQYKKSSYQSNRKIILEAEYYDKKAAIISKKLEKGNIILSHVHPEHYDSNLDNTFKRIFSSYGII